MWACHPAPTTLLHATRLRHAQPHSWPDRHVGNVDCGCTRVCLPFPSAPSSRTSSGARRPLTTEPIEAVGVSGACLGCRMRLGVVRSPRGHTLARRRLQPFRTRRVSPGGTGSCAHALTPIRVCRAWAVAYTSRSRRAAFLPRPRTTSTAPRARPPAQRWPPARALEFSLQALFCAALHR